jgi:hypothetical protein
MESPQGIHITHTLTPERVGFKLSRMGSHPGGYSFYFSIREDMEFDKDSHKNGPFKRRRSPTHFLMH